jgi:hypothetical protein
VHPYVSQSLATERIKDLRRQAGLARLARQVRSTRRRPGDGSEQPPWRGGPALEGQLTTGRCQAAEEHAVTGEDCRVAGTRAA